MAIETGAKISSDSLIEQAKNHTKTYQVQVLQLTVPSFLEWPKLPKEIKRARLIMIGYGDII